MKPGPLVVLRVSRAAFQEIATLLALSPADAWRLEPRHGAPEGEIDSVNLRGLILAPVPEAGRLAPARPQDLRL